MYLKYYLYLNYLLLCARQAENFFDRLKFLGFCYQFFEMYVIMYEKYTKLERQCAEA